MKAILFSVGTRGDIEPFMAIAQFLKDSNWEVICAFPEQFRELVEDAGFNFYGLNPQFLELIEGEHAKNVMGQKGSLLQRIRGIVKLYRLSLGIQRALIIEQHDLIQRESPDRVVYSGKSLYPVIWGVDRPGRSIMVSPVPCLIHPVKNHAAMGIKGDWGPRINRLTYRLVNFFFFKTIYRYSKDYHQDVKSMKISPGTLKRHFLKKEKMLYTVSPALFPRPEDWPKNARVVGYHERSKTVNWQPEKELLEFIANYDKILFITFGSMSNTEPENKTRAIINVLLKHRIPAIINTSWGGLVKPEAYPEHVFFVNNIPYDWAFPKMYAVLHHGGSGTTHTALKYGCANMIVPHIIDQFYWNERVAQLSAGPKGMSIKRLNEKRLEPKLLDLMQNAVYKENAEKIGSGMRKEDLKESLLNAIINL